MSAEAPVVEVRRPGGGLIVGTPMENVEMTERARINGVFLGYVNRVQTSARIKLVVDDQTASWEIAKLGDDAPGAEIVSASPAVTTHAVELTGAIERIGGDGEPLQRKPRPPKPVPCPECYGIQSAHCDTCEGAGVVPG